jgi:phosphatidylglycerophosphate synthase
MTPTESTDRIQIAVDGSGPRFLGLTTAERNRRVARRAESRDPKLSGMLRMPDDVALTGRVFDVLPREGTWHIAWHPARPPLAWQGQGSIGPPRVIPVPDGSIFDVSSTAARRTSAWRLLRQSGKPTDGWLARHVHRKISRVFSYVLLQLGLTANHATLLTAVIGLASAWFMAQTSHQTMIAGAFLLWFASIADGIDGEMARLSLSESAYGEQLDTLVDHFTHALCYAGIVIGWWRQGIGPRGTLLAAGVAVALPATLLFAMHLVRRASGAQHFFVDTKPIEFAVADAARARNSVPLRLAAAVFVLFRREAFSVTFALVSLATGWRGVYPMAVAAALGFVLLTLVLYVKPIEDAMRGRFAALAASYAR